ncbi:DgyrCDS44 [Dimorphilus gyrociliatus]|uniref:DgyrCDS44 n=1 Tax=Dimorphilus gyrociliatus TaxID=2664684 RepID=A0A7I8V3G7_9ANNE|nr:DgyrCDS44 [Dimorphilus gyrociliatus]
MKTLSVQGCCKIEKKGQQNWPNHRSKLACCIRGFKVYLCGGDGFDSTDFWIYHTNTDEWTKLESHGDAPKRLQSHSLHPDWDNNLIYIFGGLYGLDTPLWSFDIDNRLWTKIESLNGPSSRTGHEAILEKDNRYLHVFGGYVSVQGSTNEHWTFDTLNKTWILKKEEEIFPCARHDFGAISDNADWWIFGGSCQLEPLNDLWTYTFCKQQWTRIKTRKVPEPIYGHKLIYIRDTILIVGGNISSNSTWGFNLKKLKWLEVSLPDNMPTLLHHRVILINDNGETKSKKPRDSYCYWRKAKISPNNELDPPEYDTKIFINRAFSIESKNYGNNFFQSYKFNAQTAKSSSDNLLLSDLDYRDEDYEIDSISNAKLDFLSENTDTIGDDTETETEFSKLPATNELNQILILGCHKSFKFSPLTMWKLTLSCN